MLEVFTGIGGFADVYVVECTGSPVTFFFLRESERRLIVGFWFEKTRWVGGSDETG